MEEQSESLVQSENLVQSESIGPTAFVARERDVDSEDSVSPTFGSELLSGDIYGSKIREINIKPISYGFIVKVGCQTVAVEEAKTLANALSDYLLNPADFERNWDRNKNLDKYK